MSAVSATIRVRYVARSVVEKSDGSPRLFIGMEDVASRVGRLSVAQLSEKSAMDALLARAGDVLFGKLRPYLAKSYLVPEDVSCTGEFLVLRPRPGCSSRFLFYLTLSQPWLEWAEATSYGSKMPRTSWELMAETETAAPEIRDQEAVADFLEAETAKIDALIAKQEHLIATLREDRTATITHAVTRGLDPDVEFQAMGVDLPDVPNHWQVQPIKHLGRLVTGRTPDTSEEGHYSEVHEGFPWFRPEDLDTTGKPSTASRWISESGWAIVPHLPAPSVHVVSIGATLGKIGYVEKESSSNQQITAIIGASCPRFLYFALVASYEQIWASSMGNTIPIISAGRLGAINVPVPPEEEQRTIVAYLDEFCRRVDSLILKAQEVVLTLQEYRSALITDAVTGKIDVRGAA